MAASDFQIVTRNKLSLLESAALAEIPWLAHGFSLRYALYLGEVSVPGAREFNLGFTAHAQPNDVERNRRRFLKALDSRAAAAALHQIHSAIVWQICSARDSAVASSSKRRPAANDSMNLDYRPGGWPLPSLPASHESPSGDALVTAERGILLTIRTADCLPVLMVDRRQRVIAAVHAGWRGALARVIEKTVGEMRRRAGSRPEDLVAVLGPAIGRCCYEVGDEVIGAFRGQFAESDSFFHKRRDDLAAQAEPHRSDLRYNLLFHIQAPPGHRREKRSLHLDLAAVARAQLRAAGVEPRAIYASEHCTACRSDLFFSHRRDGSRAGRLMAAIGIR